MDFKHHVYLLWTPIIRPRFSRNSSEFRRDQEEGAEMDSHEELRRFYGSRRDEEEGDGAGPKLQALIYDILPSTPVPNKPYGFCGR